MEAGNRADRGMHQPHDDVPVPVHSAPNPYNPAPAIAHSLPPLWGLPCCLCFFQNFLRQYGLRCFHHWGGFVPCFLLATSTSHNHSHNQYRHGREKKCQFCVVVHHSVLWLGVDRHELITFPLVVEIRIRLSGAGRGLGSVTVVPVRAVLGVRAHSNVSHQSFLWLGGVAARMNSAACAGTIALP